MNSKDILNTNDEQNMGVDRSIEILAEMTRENTEKTLSYLKKIIVRDRNKKIPRSLRFF